MVCTGNSTAFHQGGVRGPRADRVAAHATELDWNGVTNRVFTEESRDRSGLQSRRKFGNA